MTCLSLVPAQLSLSHPHTPWRICCAGAGVAGLTCASLLAAEGSNLTHLSRCNCHSSSAMTGLRVEIAEASDGVGGR
eukprot:2793287-Amphidinium_carterae.1